MKRSMLRGGGLCASDTNICGNGSRSSPCRRMLPTTPTTAFPIGGLYGDSVLMQYADQLAVTANHAGIPCRRG